ncbi:TetR/AcrR family transcriptional regulator [Actinacidiphila soli]|uniref:TetR/AcrR family transcriptional regulator n=1 Tax=Actinacidiphila soli TaxID=2487275 RepID=UPI000FCA4A20|nr:TetR/AcrR family transcriptional regulator [Actinacidiphila soli]
MPRLSEERREERRRHILTSAWSCFSRNGFHATSMDDVIAATGMSSSAVYRYFRSKDELIDAAADEALRLIRDLFDRLLDQHPTPSPADVVTAMCDEVASRTSHPDYDLTRIAIQSWGEALRRPELEERSRSLYLSVHGRLVELSARWREEGQLSAEADDAQIATVLMSLMPGILVGRNLVANVSAAHLTGGLSALGVALGTR